MPKVRGSFTDEFKREAVALLQTSGRPLMQIASELGIQPSMLRNWRNAVLGVPAGVSQRPNTVMCVKFCKMVMAADLVGSVDNAERCPSGL